MQEILPGIWHWTTEHPDLGQRVSSYAVPGAGLTLDPFAPEGGAQRLRDLGVASIALTCRLHRRDVAELQRELDARVLVPEPGLHAFADDDEIEAEGYGDGDRVAGGVRAHALGAIAPDDFVLHITVDHGALAFADGLTTMSGEIGLMPDGLMDDPPAVKAKTVARVRELLELDFDALLFAHGDPIPSGGKAALRAWLDQAGR